MRIHAPPPPHFPPKYQVCAKSFGIARKGIYMSMGGGRGEITFRFGLPKKIRNGLPNLAFHTTYLLFLPFFCVSTPRRVGLRRRGRFFNCPRPGEKLLFYYFRPLWLMGEHERGYCMSGGMRGGFRKSAMGSFGI